MKRYLQFFLGVISILIGMCCLAIQSEIEVTTLYSVASYIFFVTGGFILNDLVQKNFFTRTEFFFKKIYGWRNGSYENVFMYLTWVIFSLLCIGLFFLIFNVVL